MLSLHGFAQASNETDKLEIKMYKNVELLSLGYFRVYWNQVRELHGHFKLALYDFKYSFYYWTFECLQAFQAKQNAHCWNHRVLNYVCLGWNVSFRKPNAW